MVLPLLDHTGIPKIVRYVGGLSVKDCLYKQM